jgi:hypothetical protein
MTTAPALKAATVWANWALAPLKLIDRNGAKIQHYRLFLDGGWGPGEFFAWLTSDIIYLLVVIPASYSSQLLDFAINPETWLTPIQKAWTSVTSGLFDIISPTALLAAVLLAALLMIVVRARNADEALQGIVQRTVASLGMYALILALLYNPVGTLRDVLTGWVKLLGGFDDDAAAIAAATSQPTGEIPAIAGSGHEVGDVVTNGTDSSVLTNFLRPLTWMLNYGSQLSPQCAKQWARLIELGEPMTCLSPDQIQASQSVGTAFVMTMLALIPVFIYCRFGIVVIITFAAHLLLAVVRFAAAAALAAVSPWQERPFDEFMRFMVSAVANLIIASGIVTAARLGPKAAVAIADSVTDSTLVHFTVLVAAYHLLSLLVWGLEKQFGPIRSWLLKAATNATPSANAPIPRWWSLAFPGGLTPQTTALDRMISRARQQGSQWAHQTREQVTRMANDKLLADAAAHASDATANLASASATPGLVPDTAQSASLAAVVNTADNQHSQHLAPPTAATAQAILTRLTPQRQLRAPSPNTPAPTQVHSPAPDHHNPNTTQFLTSAASDGATPPHDTRPPRIDTAFTGNQHWRARLRQDASALAAATAGPEFLRPLTIASSSAELVSTLTDPRGNALDLPGAHDTPAAYLARVAYMEIVMRAMGWQPTLDSRALLPSGTTFFTSGLDEDGNWVTEFHN